MSEQALETLQGIEQLLSPEANYSVYRAHVKRFRRSSCVPYVGLLLKDLTFINDGNPKRLEDGSVNFAKAWQLFEVLSEFSNFQKHRIAIAPDPSIAQLLRSLPLPDEDVRAQLFMIIMHSHERFVFRAQFTYKASLAAEPRSPPSSASP